MESYSTFCLVIGRGIGAVISMTLWSPILIGVAVATVYGLIREEVTNPESL